MAARTVLSTTQSGLTSYSTASLAVGDLTELAIDMWVTAATGGTVDSNGYYTFSFQVYRVDANGNNCLLLEPVPMLYCDWGAGAPATGAFNKSYGAAINQWSFGDHVKIMMTNANGITVDFNLSIIGK